MILEKENEDPVFEEQSLDSQTKIVINEEEMGLSVRTLA